MAANAYGKFLQHQAKADIDWDSVPLKAMAVTASYTPNYDTDEFRAGVTGELAASGGYSAGGISLTSEAATLDTSANHLKFDAADADFGTLTAASPITGIIVYVDTGSSATDILVSHHTFSGQSPSGVNFTYSFHADGIGYISY